MNTSILRELAGTRNRDARPIGLTSVCSAHPLVIEAALRQGQQDGREVLIEATCNQVNQEGGYTGMTPATFRAFVETIADKVGFERRQLILGGDHLGPNPWKHLPAEDAMIRACTMVESYVAAGFSKIHLDASMGCLGENVALLDEQVADRTASMAEIAEASASRAGSAKPFYVVGTEVPIPGGALESVVDVDVTSAEAAIHTIEVNKKAFADRNLEGAFERVVGVVVQPGVEFGNEDVVPYDPSRTIDLIKVLEKYPGLVFEAHSTDYQSPEALASLVQDGFSILKVGPALTFALREALYGLAHISEAIFGPNEHRSLLDVMESAMIDKPEYWTKYYHGTPAEQRVLRHFSYSDRIRYYWSDPKIMATVSALLERLSGCTIPATLARQYLGPIGVELATQRRNLQPNSVLIGVVQSELSAYSLACGPVQPDDEVTRT